MAYNSSDKPQSEQSDEEILREIIECCAYMRDRWAKIREQGDLNMRALSIDGPIPDELRAERNKPENRRPCGHTDIISFANNRVVNQWRMNPRGVQVNPTGSGASKETARIREERMREIAYSSQAKSARLCAFQNAVDRGYGFWEVYLEYESPRSSKQKICVGRIPNPNSVLIDPDTIKADRSDMRYAAKLGRKLTVQQFKRKYPKAKDVSSFPADVLGVANQFVSTDGKFVTPAEYWRVVQEKKVLLTLGDGSDVLDDEMDDEPMNVVSQRETEVSKVEHFVTNGLEILSRDVWPGSTIPLITVVGREKYEEDELTIEALTAKAREPQLNFDLARMNEVESIIQTPKSKWVVSDEQIQGYEAMWANAHRDPTAFLMVHERDSQGQPIAHPERTDYEPPVQALEIAANSFLRDAQNTLGMTTIEKVDKVSKSGVAQRELNEAQDIGTFHFTDNMISAVEYEGRIENELLAIIEDSKRTVGLRKPSGEYKTLDLEPIEGQPHPYGPASSHEPTISTGPDYQSQREEKIEFLTEITKQPEFLTNPLAPMVIHEMEIGPGGDKMERVALAVQPPAVQAAYAEDKEGKPPMPPEAVQIIEKLKAEMTALNEHAKQLETQVIELEDDIKAQKVKAESQEKISTEDNATKMAIEQAKIESEFRMQEMKQEFELRMKALEIEIKKLDLERERIRGSMQMDMQDRAQEHESSESERDRMAAAEAAKNGSGE